MFRRKRLPSSSGEYSFLASILKLEAVGSFVIFHQPTGFTSQNTVHPGDFPGDPRSNQTINFMEHCPSWRGNRTSGSQKILAFFESHMYTPVFTKAFYLSISPTRWIQSTLPHFIHLIYILISSHLDLELPNRLFPSGFPIKVPNTFIFSPIRTKFPAHFILLHLIPLTKSAKKY